jgi:hypothetical protein
MRGLELLAVRLWTAALAVLVVFSVVACAGEEAPLRTTLARKWERRALQRALSGAIHRLERPRCQRIFSDFKLATGRVLQEELDALGQTGPSFLRGWIFFADGRQEPRCADPRVLAMTQPGSRSVWICGSQFSREHRRAPGETEVVLIHEALHVLGLGEDPPSSATISRQVVARCGS